ncbi:MULTISPECIES: hypothetical protein [unclassified Psychrobacter]|jgi:tryptophan 2,3-dioxygenase|nr:MULTISPECIES: hypothetical protein [unclassified Psychrobacter]MBE8610416.1 hypothetical protein [Pseudomonas lundensis]
MKALNHLFTFISGIVVLTVCSLGIASANNEYAMVAAEPSSAEAYAKAQAAGKVARAEAYAKADAAIAKANAAIAKAEIARTEEKAARVKVEAARAEAYAKAHAAWAQSSAEAKADRAVSFKRIELKELSTH